MLEVEYRVGRPSRALIWARRAMLLAAAVIVVAAVALAAAPRAGAGVYKVAQCHWLEGIEHPNVGGRWVEITGNATYPVNDQGCHQGSTDWAIRINNNGPAPALKEGRVTWTAPPGTVLAGVAVQGKLRRELGHKARLELYDDHGARTVLARGSQGPTGFVQFGYPPSKPPQRRFVAKLICDLGSGRRCDPSVHAKTWVRNVRLDVRDPSPPRLGGGIQGSLFAGPVDSWVRGTRTVNVRASDVGGGLRQLGVQVNGRPVPGGTATFNCDLLSNGWARTMVPCPVGDPQQLAVSLDTTKPPFHEGRNKVRICARDYGVFSSNQACWSTESSSRKLRVDNTAPSVAFANAQDPNDPELIHALVGDRHSGVRSGKIQYRPAGRAEWRDLGTTLEDGVIRARVDSVSQPAGNYEFRAVVTDRAGNLTWTTRRGNGSEMVLTFPLRSEARLRASLPDGAKRQSVSYRKKSKVTGRLTTAEGEPLAGEPVTVTERFDDGALIDTRVREVETGKDGRYGSKLPGGPSRRVSVSYEGSPRFTAERAGGLKLRVRSKATLATSKRRVRAGRRVTFRGKVKHFAARVPGGGKLIELQVRERPGRWNTVREAFPTRANGRFRFRWRFGSFYIRKTRFRFRVKVTREQGWPYKAPVRSRKRWVTVVPKR